MMKYQLAQAAHHLQGQPMFKVLAKVKELEAKGIDICHFEIGDPDFQTPQNIVEAACKSLQSGDTHYETSDGNIDFRKVICDTTEKNRGFRPDLSQVLVTPGANIIIYYAVRCLVNPGDDVLVPDPGFPTYYSVLDFCGVNPIRVPLREEDGFRMNPDLVEQSITKSTRMIILNSPHNPTGATMTPDEIKRIYEIAEEHDIYIYSDEIYSRMIFDDDYVFATPAIYDQCRKRTIIANGFSKAFAMTGWRLGTSIAPTFLTEKMSLLLQTTSSCVSPFLQKAGIEAITGSQDDINKMMKEYKERRDLLVDGLNDIDGITCLRPGGSFYVFPNIKGTGLNSEQFADLMLEKGHVSLLPGTNFGIYGEGYVRLCYATSKERILEGLKRIKKALKKDVEEQ
ncbi:MAG: pyridoxal phosphate-dependent aminotransferase [Christensenellaceae bacterium]